MNSATLFNFFLIFSALIGFTFSFILFCSKNGREKSMLYLNLLIISISLNNIQSWALEKQLFQHKFSLDYLQIPWHFLAMPFLYMFLINYLNVSKKAFNILKIIIPVFLVIIITQITFVVSRDDVYPQVDIDYIYEKYTSFEEIFSLVVSFSIFIYSFYILHKKERIFSKIASFDNLKWLFTFFKLTAIGYTLWIIALIIKVKMNYTGFIFSYYPLRIYTTILIYWLGYQGLQQIRILNERKKIRKSLLIDLDENKTETIDINTKDSPSEKQKKQFLEIDSFITKNKKFLLPKYTLKILSNETKLSSSTLSLIINNIARKSFTDYLNQKRIKQAKLLLLDSDYSNYTITAIGLECGFNSKSTFYTVFKKQCGCTPVQFKKQKN
ncbi:AraC family transcriptional regulator [Tenacibaculum soleae]|nr:AraC family transcriptional regulator [Tenacibaculum soleae]